MHGKLYKISDEPEAKTLDGSSGPGVTVYVHMIFNHSFYVSFFYVSFGITVVVFFILFFIFLKIKQDIIEHKQVYTSSHIQLKIPPATQRHPFCP